MRLLRTVLLVPVIVVLGIRAAIEMGWQMVEEVWR